MLRNYLTTVPYTKLVIIEDSVKQQGKQIFDFLLRNHIDRSQNSVHYFVFHNNIRRAEAPFAGKSNVVVHDFSSNVCGWDLEEKKEDFEEVASRLGVADVVVIDSLAHVVFQCGLSQAYRILNQLKTQTAVQQILTLLHVDLLQDKDKVVQIFRHLSTLSLTLQPKFMSDNFRVQYIYKKLGGKIVKQTEEYRFEDNNLITEKIERPDPKKLLEKAVLPEVNPETLSTFKIGLSDKDKKSRDNLVLPYLPQNENSKQGGKIIYQFDEEDDWDEEDPDDDLDI